MAISMSLKPSSTCSRSWGRGYCEGRAACVEELESFCKRGYIPPLYDAYAASQQDIEKMKAVQQASPVVEHKDGTSFEVAVAPGVDPEACPPTGREPLAFKQMSRGHRDPATAPVVSAGAECVSSGRKTLQL